MYSVMVIKGIKRSRGRTSGFALDTAIEAGQHLFHQHGYENVSVAALTEAIGITRPSLYAAFGSKAAFFKNTRKLYSATMVPLDRFLVPGQPPLTVVRNLLKAADRAYAAHPQQRGSLIVEHGNTRSTEWGMAAKQITGENRARVQAFLESPTHNSS